MSHVAPPVSSRSRVCRLAVVGVAVAVLVVLVFVLARRDRTSGLEPPF